MQLMTETENERNLAYSPAERPPHNYQQMVEEDLLTSFRFKPGSLQYHLIKSLFKKPLFHLSEFLMQLDDHLARTNVANMAKLALEQLTSGLSIHGEPKIPAEGPVLIVSNHPGWIDSFVALAGITRPDIYFLAGSHPTLEALPHFRDHLIFVKQTGVPSRAATIRHIIEYLKDGKVVVIFPKGLLEPDPSLIPGAKQSILEWNDSVGIFLNKVPETTLQPMLISQVVHPQAWDHWAINLFKKQRRRQQLAIALQFALSLQKNGGAKWKILPRLDFGEAISAHDLSSTLNLREISQNLKELMVSLLAMVYTQ
jgi:1-acyl-sn-glycerol-3-phosphate acyltransferase